jgi:NAD(P)-dependent dehydrogenase (short-subunit alcohol dehydrogenase family)
MTIDAFYDQRSQNIPLGRVEEANESGDVIWFLPSDRARYLTGPSINIDGGTSGAIQMSQLYIGSFLCLQK